MKIIDLKGRMKCYSVCEMVPFHVPYIILKNNNTVHRGNPNINYLKLSVRMIISPAESFMTLYKNLII